MSLHLAEFEIIFEAKLKIIPSLTKAVNLLFGNQNANEKKKKTHVFYTICHKIFKVKKYATWNNRWFCRGASRTHIKMHFSKLLPSKREKTKS